MFSSCNICEQALKSLNRRFDETKLFYNNSPEDILKTSRIFFQVHVMTVVLGLWPTLIICKFGLNEVPDALA